MRGANGRTLATPSQTLRVPGHHLERFEFPEFGNNEDWYGWRCSCMGEASDGYGCFGEDMRACHRHHLYAVRAQMRLDRWVAEGRVTFDGTRYSDGAVERAWGCGPKSDPVPLSDVRPADFMEDLSPAPPFGRPFRASSLRGRTI